MSDLMNTALSGLIAAQRGMAVTGHNIANVSTPGYSRQTTQQGTREAFGSGGGFIGSGVNITSVQRSFDSLIQSQVRSSLSEYGRLDAFSNIGVRLDNINANSQAGLAGSMERFFNALQSVGASPSDPTTRELLLSEADALVQQVRRMDSQLATLENDVNARVGHSVERINSLATSLADVNQRIAIAYGSFGQPPNDLLDRRDELTSELSKLVNVTTTEMPDGSMSVFIGQGQPLVLGQNAHALSVVPDPFDLNRVQVAYQSGGGPSFITSQLTGGELGGLLDARRDLVDPARLTLGRTVTAVVNAVNEQHALGMDLRGDLGGLFFDPLSPVSVRNVGNTSPTTVTLAIDDWQALEAADYNLRFDAGNWVLSGASNGEVIPMTGTGTPGDPFLARGMSIAVAGVPANGDGFRLRPVAQAPEQFRVAITDGGAVAAASPVRVTGPNASVQILDPSNPALQTDVDITFLTPTSYSVDGGPPQAWAQGDVIEANGWRLTISGQPAVGTLFEVESNLGAVGDNRNALAMNDVRYQRVIDNGTTTIAGGFQNATARVGVMTQQAMTMLETQTLVRDQAMGARESLAGVNLDEEAARLVQLQQAFQASAQVIAVAATLFDSLLAATRR